MESPRPLLPAEHKGRVWSRFSVTVSSWGRAFSLQNLRHNLLPGLQMQSVPQTPTHLPNASETQDRAPLPAQGDAERLCLWSRSRPGAQRRWLRGPSRSRMLRGCPCEQDGMPADRSSEKERNWKTMQ